MLKIRPHLRPKAHECLNYNYFKKIEIIRINFKNLRINLRIKLINNFFFKFEYYLYFLFHL